MVGAARAPRTVILAYASAWFNTCDRRHLRLPEDSPGEPESGPAKRRLISPGRFRRFCGHGQGARIRLQQSSGEGCPMSMRLGPLRVLMALSAVLAVVVSATPAFAAPA